MATNLSIDPKLLERALAVSGERTKKATVTQALEEFIARRERYDIGSFYTDPNLGKENRCDLHPRWSPDGRQVCIDSVHEGARQRYIIDVGELTRPDLPGRS